MLPPDAGRFLRRGTSLEYRDYKDSSIKTDEDRLLSKIEQDNRLLEELDRAKPRASGKAFREEIISPKNPSLPVHSLYHFSINMPSSRPYV